MFAGEKAGDIIRREVSERMMKKCYVIKIFCAVFCFMLTGCVRMGFDVPGEKNTESSCVEVSLPVSEEDIIPEDEGFWQGTATFPDWKGYTDNTLAMNSMYSFFGYHGQGRVYLKPSDKTEKFSLYLNGALIDSSEMTGGKNYSVDISDVSIDGENTVQISNIEPYDPEATVTIYVQYPEIAAGVPDEEGLSEQSLEMISDLIESDIDNGFTSAQLAVIRNGRLVYENAWGSTNSYLPDGTKKTDSPKVTTDTLYDIASVTKMFSVNYALQKLLTDEKITLDARIVDFLGDEFAEKTILAQDDEGKLPEADIETIKRWKSSLTVRDLLYHQGGFPADPRYQAPLLYRNDPEEGETFRENQLFAGNGADEKTRKKTLNMINKTPLLYEPGTQSVYSDVDYMVLGLVVEKVTGKGLDVWLKENIYDPVGLGHITYNPLKNGFSVDDCAATELNGNTRDGLLDYEGYRTETIQGEVHDEKAYYCMMGVSGHAGLFSNATDLAKLASVMLCGGYGKNRFFSRNVMDVFTAPKSVDSANMGLGWWRQGDGQRIWYYGTSSSSDTIGHQGWTGTIVMVDPEKNLVIAYLTNKRNSRITDPKKDANQFDGNWYTASTLGFVPQILSVGMDTQCDVSRQLMDLSADMVTESIKLIPEDDIQDTHPSILNVKGKLELFEKMADKCDDEESAEILRDRIDKVVCLKVNGHNHLSPYH